MSGMANEMAARMRADGEDLSRNIDATAPLDPAAEPGTERTPATPPPPPPAGAQNTETVVDGQEPGPVPYSRFREVNEAYRELQPYDALRQYGYDADSLGRLAQFEASYVQDPTGTVAFLADNLDVPDEVKTQIRELLEAESAEPPAGEGTPPTPGQSEPEPPPWAKKIIDREEQRERQELEARENASRQAALDEVLSHWNELDKAAGIQVREGIKLSLIASLAATGQYQTPQQLAEAARGEYLADREAALGSHIVPPGNGIGPRSVPRSAAVPSPPQTFGGDIKKATAAVRAAMERGELPTVTPGG